MEKYLQQQRGKLQSLQAEKEKEIERAHQRSRYLH